jgi:hypothetical protein
LTIGRRARLIGGRVRRLVVLLEQPLSLLPAGAVQYVREPVARRWGLKDATSFSAVLEMDPNGEGLALALAPKAVYRVTERALKQDEAATFYLFAPVVRAKGLSREAFDAHWSSTHANLALRHHVAMCDYRQMLAEALLGPPIDGVARLGFASKQAFETGFLDSTAGGRIIAEDSARFVDGSRGAVLLARRM